MVTTFMEGVNPQYVNFLRQCLHGIFSKLSGAMARHLDLKDGALTAFEDRFKVVSRELESEFSKEAMEHRRAKHVMPILEILRVLPKDELAAMAEALVSLTALKRRVTRSLETVGGPVDVCVISKGDGLVWVKQKTYFDSGINQHFSSNYWRNP